MIPRSLLFVPGDSERKIAKSASAAADIVILDLEDSVAAQAKGRARDQVRQFLLAHPTQRTSQLWVRINALQSAEALTDLAAIVSARPDGVVLPKSRSAEDVIRLAAHLDRLEAAHGLEAGVIRILPVATEVPEAVFSLGTYVRGGPRLYALTWGAEDLCTAVGATTNRLEDGSWTSPYQLVRSLCLFGAAAAEVPAFDTLHADFRDAQGLRFACTQAHRDGFAGKLAIHPDQVPVINECFTPTAAEIAHAHRVIECFALEPGVAAVSLDGRMLDVPHLRQAQKILARAGHPEHGPLP